MNLSVRRCDVFHKRVKNAEQVAIDQREAGMSGTRLVAALAFSVMSAIWTSTPAEAFMCKSGIIRATAVQKTKSGAYNKAVAAWPGQARSRHGLPWSVWRIAKNKTVACTPNGALWRCQARAMPCKLVVL